MIFVVDRFTPSAFGLATAVKEFSTAADHPKIIARTIDNKLLAGSPLRPITIGAAFFGRDRVWHIDDMFAPFCLAICALCLVTGRRVVICPHGMLNRWALRSRRPRLKLAALRTLNALAKFGHLQVHALNRAEARKAKCLLPNTRRIEVVSNGVPSDILSIRDRLPPRSDRKGSVIVGCMSRISPQKNQMAIVDLAAHLRQHYPEACKRIRFRIDGQVDDAAYANAIRAEITRQSLTDSVTIGGSVAFDARAELLSGYDVFFLPSKSEGMPYAVLEVMALGTPTLASHLSSCGFIRAYGGRVYRTIDEAAAILPINRADLSNWRVDTEGFIAKFDSQKLRIFFNRLAG